MSDNRQNPIFATSADSPFDGANRAEIEAHLQKQQMQLQEMEHAGKDESIETAQLLLDIADAQVGLEAKSEAWTSAKKALDIFLINEKWQEAVEACNLLYLTEEPSSLVAWAHGVWLAVTFPIQPELTITLLTHIVDETPANSDGAAVAAVTAHYVVDLRAKDEEQHKNLSFLTGQILSRVAERHSQIENQDQLNMWMDRLKLRDPQVFLPHLATILDILVEDKWWFDRDKLRTLIPDN